MEEKAEENVKSTKTGKFQCYLCQKYFSKNKNVYQHIRKVHKMEPQINATLLCPLKECKHLSGHYSELRNHLFTKHGKEVEKVEYVFNDNSDFLRWKESIEKSDKVYYHCRNRKTCHLGRKTYYSCHRSICRTKPKKDSVRAPKYQVCSKMTVVCPSTIQVVEKDNVVQVTHYKTHMGHGVDPQDLTLNSATASNETGDVLFNDLLEGVRVNLTNEAVVPLAVRKRDVRLLKDAFCSTADLNTGLGDAESVNRWVGLCMQLEDSPVLCYRHSEREDGREEFLLVIMTEFQKQLLMSSDKKIICVDCIHRRKGGRFYLTCLSIVDECNVAFPISFCISDKMDEGVTRQFLMAVKKSTGPLSYKYFMSDIEDYYFDVWKEVMDDSSQWLWSMWKVTRHVQTKLKNFFKSQNKREKAEIYKTVRTLLECPNHSVFESIFKKFLDSLIADPLNPLQKFGAHLLQKFAPNTHLWAYCYRIDTKLEANFQLSALNSTLKFCTVEGRKTRLDRFIHILMKFLKFKTLERLKIILDDEKIEMVKETIRSCHKSGLDISTDSIASLSDKVWLIKSEDENVYVVRDFDSCPDHCLLQCDDCNICVHMYSCSCIPSMINANLCQHIHAVVWKFLTPHHFSPMPSPFHDDDDMDIDNNDSSQSPKKGSEILDKVLKMSHDIYKSVVANKSSLSDETLTQVMAKLSKAKECIDIGTGKKAPPKVETPFVPTPEFLNKQFQALQVPNIKGKVSQMLLPKLPIMPSPQKYIILIPSITPSSTAKKN